MVLNQNLHQVQNPNAAIQIPVEKVGLHTSNFNGQSLAHEREQNDFRSRIQNVSNHYNLK